MGCGSLFPSNRDPSADSMTSLMSNSTGHSLSPQTTTQRPHSITSKYFLKHRDILKKFEGTKVVVRSCKSKKDRQYNGQKKKDRQYNGKKKKDRQYNGKKKKHKKNDPQNTMYKA